MFTVEQGESEQSCFERNPLSAAEWIEIYKNLKEGKKMCLLRRHTLHFCLKAFKECRYLYSSSTDTKPIEVPLKKELISDAQSKTILCAYNLSFGGFTKTLLKEIPVSTQPSKITFGGDTILCGRELRLRGLNPALLNFANAYFPGGGYEMGMAAQEENLCRRSNLSLCLRNELYPIPHNGCIYSPQVYFIRGQETDGYPFFETPFNCDVISSAAIAQPDVYFDKNDQKVMYREALEMTFHRILIILYTAFKHGNDSLVLGAFGCGAFMNPAPDVALLFYIAIHKYFRGVFKEIAFAILARNGKFEGFQDNRAIFEKQFSTVLSIKEIETLEKDLFKNRLPVEE